MHGRIKALSAAFALSVVAGMTTGVSLAPAAEQFALSYSKIEFAIGGNVGALQKDGSSTIRVDISLHGLEPGHEYLVVGSRLTCRQTATMAVDGADFLVWQRTVKAAPGSDDVFRSGRVRARGRLATVKSVRVYERAGSRRPQRACGKAEAWVGIGAEAN
jgi:hypothetical protein